MSDVHKDQAARYFERLEKGGGVEPTVFERLLPHGRRPCPFCGSLMIEKRTYGAITDVCPQHGRWLDADQWELFLAACGSRRRSGRLRSLGEEGEGGGAADGSYSP
jgi:hypothetical protein